MFHSHSLPAGWTLTLVSIIVLHLCSCVHSVPLMRDEYHHHHHHQQHQQHHQLQQHQHQQEQEDQALYTHLHDVLRQAFLQDRLSPHLLPDVSPHHPPSPHHHSLPRPPTDTPSLTDLLRSALHPHPAGSQLEGRSPTAEAEAEAAWPQKGREVLKRSFDSISRNSGFGLPRGSWGGYSRYGGDNLTFTFESLFPAIARGLRSIRR